ncbi:MAG: YggS family pyridoxal phosphate-dependent enzyme [Planctomycetia bacterium]|nr:YggS family pyridoxal phosphate-dependent enzyme [Planctomycetia bacterium]
MICRYLELLETIHALAVRAGRNPDEVRLLAVTKYFGTPQIDALAEMGCRDFGENRLPVFSEKVQFFSERADFRWHFIGPLQKNKARRVLKMADWIHSGESLELLQTLDRVSAEENLQKKVLVEINLGGEENKHGFSREAFEAAWEEIQQLSHLRIVGLMGMTSLDADEKKAHAQFSLLREIRDAFLPGGELSMGMSHDYPIAIEEGATILRIGSALFD